MSDGRQTTVDIRSGKYFFHQYLKYMYILKKCTKLLFKLWGFQKGKHGDPLKFRKLERVRKTSLPILQLITLFCIIFHLNACHFALFSEQRE